MHQFVRSACSLSFMLGYSLVLIVLAGWMRAAAQAGPADGLPVMQYLGTRAARMEAALPPLPDDPAEWRRRREQVRRELAGLLGLPPREPMRAKVSAGRTEGDLSIENVIYLLAERCYVPGIVVRPAQAAGRLPALVVPPGFGGSAKTLDEGMYKPFVHQMARRGYVVLFFDDPSFGDRKAPLAAWYAAASAAGMQGMGVQVFDTLRGFDYLLTRADVDPGRIGVAGLCQGSEQTWLAGALEERFKVVVPVCGTTTYADWARMPGYQGVDLSSADPYVRNVLRHTDWPEIAACIAPRPIHIASNSGDNWWPEAGYGKVVARLQKIYQKSGAAGSFVHVRDLRSHSMTPYLPELAPWIDAHLKSLAGDAATAPQPCGEPPADADVNPLHYLQRRIVRQAEALPAGFATRDDWLRYRDAVRKWLGRACVVDELHLGEANNRGSDAIGDMQMEKVDIIQDQGLVLSVKIYQKSGGQAVRRPAIVLSHADAQSATCPEVVNFIRALATDGYVVAVPEHASSEGHSPRRITSYVSLYGAGDVTGLSPLAMRVWDDLAALRVVRRRDNVGPVAMVGLGVGGVDTAITAVLDDGVAAVAAVGAITVRDWTEKVAPATYQVMPCLPDIMSTTDWQYVYGAALPRPVLLVDATDRANWPAEAYLRVQRTARQVAACLSAGDRLTCKPAASPWGVEEIRRWLKDAAFIDKPLTGGERRDHE